MTFVKHRHDQMHRGQVPSDQLAEGSPDPGDVPIYQYDGSVEWGPQTGGEGGGAPTNADYLVGTANGALSGEIVVGTTPGGELGGTWASPTVDATHSGSSHAGVQAAAEGTAAAALSSHEGDPDAHHTWPLTEGDIPAEIARDSEVSAAVSAHGSAGHAAAQISVADTGGNFDGTDVEAVLEELAGMSGGPHGHIAADVTYDNGSSGLTATDVQAAIDELASATPAAAGRWVPVMDGHGNVLTDGGTGAAIMAFIT